MAEALTRADIVEIMRGERFVMMTSVSPDGTLQSYPMTPQEVTEEGVVRFFLGLQGDQAENLRENGQVNLAFAEAGSWLSVSGTVEFEQDRATIDRLWNDSAKAWFEQGPEDPNLGLLRFEGQSAQFWGQPGGRTKALGAILKTKITGQRPQGSSKTVELG